MTDNGIMTPESAERAIWSYYYQLSASRDRRSAPVIVEPPDQLTEDEIERLRDQQVPLWRKAQLKAVKLLEARSSRVGAVAKKFAGLFTTKAEQEYLERAAHEAAREHLESKDLAGTVNTLTGLPNSTADLQGGRGVVTGVDLCMEAIVPPYDLAAATTTWLPPCPPGEVESEWGKQLSHWQALAYKPKEINCPGCLGRGHNEVMETESRYSGFFTMKGEKSRVRHVQCQDCGGRGIKVHWDREEFEAVEHNAHVIAERVSELAKQGYFDERPVDSNDAEMGDLVWQDKAGRTIGFRLTWEGFRRMQEYCSEDQELQHTMHMLTLAGKDVRDQAPQWAKAEWEKSLGSTGEGVIKASSSGF